MGGAGEQWLQDAFRGSWGQNYYRNNAKISFGFLFHRINICTSGAKALMGESKSTSNPLFITKTQL